ncbi:hypothetical protein GPM19_04350 [Halomonas sp. ZH2S]|uniref:Uncharacterized protein n=1 Tax=Vreelandella zhuhanensis TaxID=2684210 RepID=A0A7X3H0N8_9GAMM|nr:inovirus Gp2 family protein [Halomonas zhuhanensis]MWJ27443.1 hypothetical protein [Halomonas zhuhanensis]
MIQPSLFEHRPKRDPVNPHWECHYDPTTFAEVFYAASYLCKAYSKPIGQVGHPFGSSRL